MLCSMPTLKPDTFKTIVANASFLWERLDPAKFTISSQPENELEINARLDLWCQSIAKGNYSVLQKRLAWDDLEFNQVRPRLGSLKLTVYASLPAWAETLEQIILTATTFTPIADLPIDPEQPLPFEDLLLPCVQVARQKLSIKLDRASLTLLTPSAYRSLERSLLKRLTELCAKTFEAEFSLVRPFGQNLLQLLQVESETGSNRTHYTKFVNQLLQDGLLSFFQKYPVLGRLVATVVDFWVDAIAEFLTRLEQDQSAIQHQFAVNSLGKVSTIDASLSDPHDRGRTVMLLSFESGLKLVYKPKNLGLEVAFNQFLAWCNQKNDSLAFKVMKILDCDRYGWVEYIDHQPCADAAAVERFYQRAGMLLCVLYALRGTDCHNENVIAHGEHLVLIDAETLMYPEAVPLGTSANLQELTATAAQQLSNSVLRTGLLPCWDFSSDRKTAYDVSGLGSSNPQQAPSKQPRWQAINTDEMHLRYESVIMPIEKNVPLLDGQVLSANDYQPHLIAGFERMYQMLITHQSGLLDPNGAIAQLRHQQIRFIFRPTRIYGVILQNACLPAHLKNGVDYSIAIDKLSFVFLTYSEKPNAWSILSAELRSLEQLDIPLFTASASSDSLPTVSQCFSNTSYNLAIQQIQRLSESDLAWQIAIIQSAFYAKVAQTVAPPIEGVALKSLEILSSEQMLAEVRAIATELEAKAVLEPNGSLNWIGLSYVMEAERYQLQAMNDSLYEGRCGVGLFFAAAYRVTGEPRYRNLALRSLSFIRQQIQSADANSLVILGGAVGVGSVMNDFIKISIGGAIGLGSMIYALVKISQLLEDTTLLLDAEALASLITPAQIAADDELDIVLGSAGAILGLVSLYEATEQEAVLATAIACGQHLLNHQISVNGAPPAWLNSASVPLTGFSHGAAGISYALLRLYAVTQDRRYWNAAIAGIEYERSAFSEAEGNWRDLRIAEPSFQGQWCHGATGIGLARTGGLDILDTPEIQSEIEIAMQTTQRYGVQVIDHLCCGNWGRVEALLTAARRCDRPDWDQAALTQATQIVDRAKRSGGYRLFPNLPNAVFHPGFFQGSAGIGYQLLRLVDDQLPSVLLWQ